MPPVLTETARPSQRSRSSVSKSTTTSSQTVATRALETLEQHVLLDGFRIVLDHEKAAAPIYTMRRATLA